MYNQVILVGIVKKVEEKSFLLNVTRDFKNFNTGEFETDNFKINVSFAYQNFIDSEDFVGSTIMIKGHIAINNNVSKYNLEIWADRIVFLKNKI